MSSFAFRHLDDGIVVIVGTAEAPDAATWRALVDAYAANPSHLLRVVIFASEIRPTRDQFARATQVLRGRDVRVAFVSPSASARVFGSMLNTISNQIKGSYFLPEEVIEALSSIEITDTAEIGAVFATAAALADEATHT